MTVKIAVRSVLGVDRYRFRADAQGADAREEGGTTCSRRHADDLLRIDGGLGARTSPNTPRVRAYADRVSYWIPVDRNSN